MCKQRNKIAGRRECRFLVSGCKQIVHFLSPIPPSRQAVQQRFDFNNKPRKKYRGDVLQNNLRFGQKKLQFCRSTEMTNECIIRIFLTFSKRAIRYRRVCKKIKNSRPWSMYIFLQMLVTNKFESQKCPKRHKTTI